MYGNRFVTSTEMATDSGIKYSVLTRDEADVMDEGIFMCRNANEDGDQDTIRVQVIMEGKQIFHKYTHTVRYLGALVY